MDRSQRDGIVFTLIPGLGRRKCHALLRQFGSVSRVLDLSAQALAELGLSNAVCQAVTAYRQGVFAAEYLQRVSDWLFDPEHHVILWEDDDYPPLLRSIPDPPLILYVRGNTDCLYQPQLAIVGSRHASRGGLENTRRFAGALSKAGFVITSGLALGIDGQAHQAAVDSRRPTVAVLGCGVDVVYPRRHSHLAEQILLHQGALVSEFALGTVPLSYNFPQRNRIISGLSAGVLVVEAALRSGSLITARQALEQGREVFALPSTLNNPQGHGCHALIREGATLVETTAHIIEPLSSILGCYALEDSDAALPETRRTEAVSGLDTELQALLILVGYEVTPLDYLVEQSGLPAGDIMAKLVGLELQGLIENRPDGYLRL
ncbi:DNA-processing protein DprA [Aliamphritea hakodatensis]|uniref:DNA-processing protein DprA n=1 Tax=Aliamphritea hakodatensis TaxID=2895352 RepID=UPI0022FD59B8|nr:DNA-processing protein DprA [Aliamphritea hakodatensis]